MPDHVTYLNDQGEPTYLDENGNPVDNTKKEPERSTLGKIWDFATTSVTGLKEPTYEEWMNNPAEAARRSGVVGMTTPLALGGELLGAAGLAAKKFGSFSRLGKTAEVLAPEAEESRTIRGLLPEGRGSNYVAGPAGNPLGVAVDAGHMTATIPPEVAARISGEAIPTKAMSPAHYGVDLDELREQNRLKNIFFNQQEQGGASRLELPDRRPISAPPTAGETKLGFEPVSRADLEYPLNVVPEAVRPRSVQEVTRALAGDEFAAPVGAKKNITFESPQAPPEIPPVEDTKLGGTAAIQPGEDILPSAREIQLAAKHVGINPEPLANAAVYAPPPVANAARQVIKEESSRPSMWRSIYSELKGQSEELYAKSFRAVQQERQYKAAWIPDFQNSINKLTKTEKQNFGGYVEGSIPITSPTVQNAVALWKQIEGAIGDEAEKVGLRLFNDSKQWVPFQKNPNYWPHMMEAGTSGRKDLLEKLMGSGMTRSEANRVIGHWRKTGEIVISPQHARTVGHTLPYRLDADAGLAHIRSMAKRISQNKEFGPLDVRGKGSEGISDLIESTSNPKKTNQLMERIIGRDEKDDQKLLKVLNIARKYSTVTKLQNFTLPNIILGQTATATRAARYPLESLSELSQLLKKSYRSEIRAAGVWQDFAQSLTEEIKPGTDWFGIGAGETINRGIAGSVGRGVARGAFNTLKSDPLDKAARKELFELLGEDINKVVQQPELTAEQLRMSAGRMAERTQGLNVPGNLPYSWSSPIKGEKDVAWQTFLIFKKMGYQATKNMWEAIKTDPKRALPMWISAAGIGGELVGDSKAFLRGLWTENPSEQIQDRGSYWLQSAGIPQTAINAVSDAAGVDPQVTARLFDNYMQAFFLGLPADMLMSSQFGPEGLMKSAAGPVIGDISSTANKIFTGNTKGLAKDAISSLPIPGSRGIAEQVLAP